MHLGVLLRGLLDVIDIGCDRIGLDQEPFGDMGNRQQIMSITFLFW